MDISGIFAKVNNANSLSTNNSNAKQDVGKTENSNLSELLLKSNGKQIEVKGEIVNVTNKNVSIKVGDQVVQGNMNLEGKLNIGDLRNFLIEMENGKLKLMLVPESSEALKDQHLENVLKDLGELSKENLQFAKALLDSNLPVNKETLAALKRSMALFGKADENALEKSLFLLKNDLPVNIKNTDSVNNILDRQQNITKNLENIDNLISKLGDEPIAQELKQILSDISNDSSVTNIIKGEPKNLENLSDVAKLVTENLDDILHNNLDDNLDILTQNNKTTTNIDDSVNTLKNLLSSANTKGDELLNQNLNASNKQLIDDNDSIQNLLDKLQNKTASNDVNGKAIDELTDTNNLDNLKQNGITENKDTNSTLLKTLIKNSGDENLEQTIAKNFGVDENISTPKDLERHINDKLDKLDKALEMLKNSPTQLKDNEVVKQLEKEITSIKDKLTFASEIKDTVFVQIPFTLNNKTTNGELIVFKDKKIKRKNKDYSSALVSLDTVNLGLFEAYVVKKQSKVDIQFRFVNDFVKDLVKSNAPTLDRMLKSKSININSLSYKKIDEPFSVIQDEPQIKEVEVLNNDNPFKFDVRG